MANRKPASSPDVNSDVAVMVRKATGTNRIKGESLLSDPKLKKAFREAKKQAEKSR